MGYSKLRNRIIKRSNLSGRRTKKLLAITPHIIVGKRSGNMSSYKPVEKSDEDNMD